VQEIVSQVLQHQHVALIGTGGVGKSSISKAVMHDERIVGHFGFHRCFVTYDGVDTSMMTHETFISRLCVALAITSSPSLTSILSTLRSASTLLVIDNAETFLGAGTEDVGKIKETIVDLGGHDTVHLILTSRSANLPNLPLIHHDVGGLDVEASRATFTSIYKHDIGTRLDSLFSSLDHHALSISLLSHVASQNAYQSTDEIEQAWRKKQTRLLKTGDGKSESLPATIELSIDSPSLRAMKAAVLAFLRTVAFLPEGVHRNDLSGIFSNFTGIEDIVSAVSLSSLTYRSGERFTMLSPIRLYITDKYNANLLYTDLFIISTRDYFYKELSSNPKSWIMRESANTERLMSFDLTSPHIHANFNDRLRTLKSVDSLLDALYNYHLRQTSLFPLLKSASEERPRIRVAGVSIGKRSSKRLVLEKAECLIDICWLQYRLRRDTLNNDMLGTAESFCRKHMPTCTKQLVSCLRLKGTQYQDHGNLFLADEALREASTLAHSLNDPLYEAVLNLDLSRILFLRGDISEATSDLMASGEEYFRSNNQHIHLVILLQARIYVLLHKKEFETARGILGQAKELDRKHNSGRKSRQLLNKKASIEGWAGNIAAAIKILDEATMDELHPGMLEFVEYVEAWKAMAYYAATVGSFDEARIFLTQAIKLESEIGNGTITNALLAAYIEFYSGELDRAGKLLEKTLEEDGQGNIQFTGFIHRVLGEVALLQEDKSEASIHFATVESMCSTSGMAPKLLYANLPHWYSLSAKYDGWIRFLDGTL